MQQANKSEMLAVIVLYNTRLEDSVTYTTLNASIKASSLSSSVGIVVYDNSSVSQVIDASLSSNLVYVNDAENGGVSKAYNYALDLARQSESEWLLLLDQDSKLPPDFVNNCLSDLRLQQNNYSIAAIVPTVYCGSKLISPCKVGWGGKLFPIKSHNVRQPDCEITAINSGALVKVAFLNSIGGFNTEFWLDMLDHWLFHTIFVNGRGVALGKNSIDHILSVSDYSTISKQRYINILEAECAFMNHYKSSFNIALFKFRLIVRALKLLLVRHRPDIFLITLSSIKKK